VALGLVWGGVLGRQPTHAIRHMRGSRRPNYEDIKPGMAQFVRDSIHVKVDFAAASSPRLFP
jgi:hypothetical protein